MRYSHPLWNVHLFRFYWHWWHSTSLSLINSTWKLPFFMAILKRKINMSQPTGFKTTRKEHMICKSKKSLYGLKQSPKQWYKRFDSFVWGKRYTRKHYDSCVYYNKLPSRKYIYLLLYVDDMLIASKSRSAIDKMKDLSFKFEMKDLGKAKKMLDMEIEWDQKDDKVSLAQKRYLKKIL